MGRTARNTGSHGRKAKRSSEPRRHKGRAKAPPPVVAKGARPAGGAAGAAAGEVVRPLVRDRLERRARKKNPRPGLKETQARLSRGTRKASIFDASGVLSRADRMQRTAWLRDRGEVAFKVKLPNIGTNRGRFAVVHREAKHGEYHGRWRLSWFDARGAAGHSYVTNYSEALERLQREEDVDLERDVLAKDVLPRENPTSKPGAFPSMTLTEAKAALVGQNVRANSARAGSAYAHVAGMGPSRILNVTREAVIVGVYWRDDAVNEERKSSIQLATGSSKHKYASDVVTVLHPEDHAAILHVLGLKPIAHAGPLPAPSSKPDAALAPLGHAMLRTPPRRVHSYDARGQGVLLNPAKPRKPRRRPGAAGCGCHGDLVFVDPDVRTLERNDVCPRELWPWRVPRPNPPIDRLQIRPEWLPLRRDGKWSAAIREVLKGRAGVYAIRERSNPSTVLYVGESHRGGSREPNNPAQFFKQILRHFSRHEPTRASGITPIWTHLRPGDLDVALWLIAPSETWCLEGLIIAELEPLHAKKRSYESCEWLMASSDAGEEAPF